MRAFNESGTQIREVDFAYGAEGEGLSVTGSTENVSVTYDAMYRVLTLSDGNSHTTTWTYGNAAGYKSQVTYPDGNSAYDTSYDSTGRLLQCVDQNGLTANFTYGDSAGDLGSISYVGHTDQNVGFTFDGYGRLTNTTDSQSTYSTTYGDRDEMVTGTRMTLNGQAFSLAPASAGKRAGQASTSRYSVGAKPRRMTDSVMARGTTNCSR